MTAVSVRSAAFISGQSSVHFISVAANNRMAKDEEKTFCTSQQ